MVQAMKVLVKDIRPGMTSVSHTDVFMVLTNVVQPNGLHHVAYLWTSRQHGNVVCDHVFREEVEFFLEEDTLL